MTIEMQESVSPCCSGSLYELKKKTTTKLGLSIDFCYWDWCHSHPPADGKSERHCTHLALGTKAGTLLTTFPGAAHLATSSDVAVTTFSSRPLSLTVNGGTQWYVNLSIYRRNSMPEGVQQIIPEVFNLSLLLFQPFLWTGWICTPSRWGTASRSCWEDCSSGFSSTLRIRTYLVFTVPGHCSSILGLTKSTSLASMTVNNHMASVGLESNIFGLVQGYSESWNDFE